MSDFDSLYGQGLYLSPQQQNLLMAALASTNHSATSNNQQNSLMSSPKSNSPSHSRVNQSPSLTQSQSFDLTSSNYLESPIQDIPGSGQLGTGSDESPFLDFDPDADFDLSVAGQLIGDLPDLGGDDPETREKRKSIDDDTEELENGKKRRESDGDKDKSAKKPGRKPLTSEPTSKRKAQNRAAQRAFRERKEKHLKDLETKVEELEKISEAASQENGVLRAQVERLQVELREYRKRLSWLSSGNGFSTASAIQDMNSRNISGSKNASNNDFYFDFPKFGDLPGSHIFNNSRKSSQDKTTTDSGLLSRQSTSSIPGVLDRTSTIGNVVSSPTSRTQIKSPSSNVTDQVGGLSKVNKSAARTSVTESFTINRPTPKNLSSYGFPSAQRSLSNAHGVNNNNNNNQTQPSLSSAGSTTDSPSASSESQHGLASSIGTSPEPSQSSPSVSKSAEPGLDGDKIDGEASFCDKLSMACGSIKDPVPPILKQDQSNHLSQFSDQFNSHVDGLLSIDWLAQQNGGNFDPVLFSDYREPQDAILSQDFGSFFNEAFSFPDLGSPRNNFNDGTTPVVSHPVVSAAAAAPKKDLVTQIDSQLDADDEEVVPGEDKSQMMDCTKIWDRLQSMEKFRNGEIDVDSLCSELRTKARCSEAGVVVQKRDVDDIMGRVSN